MFHSSLIRTALVLGLAMAPALISSTALADSVKVSTLNWPPYTGAELPKGGAITEVVRQAFDASGIEATASFVPWKRAIASAKTSADDVVAYYPGYHCAHDTGFIASQTLGSGPLGLVEQVASPISWTSLDDLSKLRVGTVLGYANTEAFDSAVKDGALRPITSHSDEASLLKLLDGEIDTAVMDKFVFEYLRNTRSALMAKADQLRFNVRPLEDKQLYLCFRDDKRGRALRDAFNAGLAKINPAEVVEAYFQNAFAR